MKKIKKIVTLCTASVMAVSAAALAACDGSNGGYGDPKSAEQVTKVIGKLNNVETGGITLEGSLNSSGQSINVSGKANAASGAFDVSLELAQGARSAYMYYFMRDWKVYSFESLNEITDFSVANLKPVADVGALIEENAGEQAAMLPMLMPAILKTVVSAENYTLLSLGKVTESVAFSGNTITMDFNLATYKMFNDFKSLIDGVEATTTVGDILGNANVKKYAEIFTELVSYNDLVGYVTLIKQMINSQGNPQIPVTYADGDTDKGEIDYTQVLIASLNAIEQLLKTVTPDAGSNNTYDYLVKLISSDELREMINSAAGQEVLSKNLSKYSIKDIVSLASGQDVTEAQVNADIEQIKLEASNAAKGITKESITIINDTTTIVESGIKYTFDYNDEYVLLSQGMTGNISVADSANAQNNGTVDINLSIGYNKEALSLVQLPSKLPGFLGGGDVDDNDENSVYGTYYFHSMTNGDTIIDNTTVEKNYMTLNLNNNGTFTWYFNGNIAATGTFETVGSTLILTTEEGTNSCRLEGKKIIMESEGALIIFSK